MIPHYGWLAAIRPQRFTSGVSREYKLNVSAAVEKQDGKWKFVMLHMSGTWPPVTK